MAIEIKEIGITMQLHGGSQPAQLKAAAEEGGCGDLDRQQIVEDVVLRVLKVLKTLKER